MTALEDAQAQELITLRAQRDALLQELEEARTFIARGNVPEGQAVAQEARMVRRLEQVRKGRPRT